MEEAESPTEQIQEHIQHEAMHSSGHAQSNWISRAALSSAFLAVFAALSSLLSGHHSNEAMIDQIQASDHWGHYQAKGIKAAILNTKIALLDSAQKEDLEKLEEYKKEQEEISEQAKEKEAGSKKHLNTHQVFARAVTLFQVAIAIAAISVLSRKRPFWYMSLVFGGLGVFFFAQGFWVQ